MKLKKILFTIFLCFNVCCSMYFTAFAANPVVDVRYTYYYDDGVKADNYNTVIEYENNKKYLNDTVNLLFVNGDVVLNADAVIENGTTLVPLRVISEKLNANVNWNSTTKTAEIQKDNVTISAPIGKKYISVNGNTIETGAETKIINSLTYVPLRAIASCFGADIGFYNHREDVNIMSVQNKNEKINISEEEAKSLAEKIYKEEFLPTINETVQGVFNMTAFDLIKEELHINVAADFGEYYYITFYNHRADGLLIDKYDRTCYPTYQSMYYIFGVGQPGYYDQWIWNFQ